jgi:hypothetical protein
MKKSNCDTCAWRRRYDEFPRSILGRIWRWHANWCPGWKSHMASLPENERKELATRYGQDKYL